MKPEVKPEVEPEMKPEVTNQFRKYCRPKIKKGGGLWEYTATTESTSI